MNAFNEPDTSLIRDRLINSNKNVYAPSLIDDKIVPSLLNGASLKRGKYNIPEPDSCIFSDIKNLDAVIVPGIAFDIYKNRIGFGGGYYDKFLSGFEGIKIGICYDFQITELIPSDAHDIKMDIIVSDKRLLN